MPQKSETCEEYRSTPWKWAGVFLAAMSFVLLGWWMAHDPSVPVLGRACGWLSMVFFGVGAPIALTKLFPGTSWLRISQEGFTVCAGCLRKPDVYKWEDIESFCVVEWGTGTGRLSRTRVIGMNFSAAYLERVGISRSIRLARKMSNVDRGLPDNYGWDHFVLAEYLTRLREFYLAGGKGDRPVRPSDIRKEPELPKETQAGHAEVLEDGAEAAAPVFHWSGVALKFTVGLGILAQIVIISELYGRGVPIWCVLGLLMPPLVLFLFVRPGELADGIVRKTHTLAAAWHLLVGLTLASLFLLSGRATVVWLVTVFPMLAAGAVPCAIVLYRATAAWMADSPRKR